MTSQSQSQWPQGASGSAVKSEGQSHSISMDSKPMLNVQAQPAFHRHFWSCVNHFYENGSLCDLHLLCQDKVVVRCHRIVLAAISPAIHRCLRSCPPVEAAAEDASVINLPDLSSREVGLAVSSLYYSMARGGEDNSSMVDLSVHSAVLDVLGVDLRRRPFYYYEGVADDENRWTEKQEQVVAKIEPDTIMPQYDTKGESLEYFEELVYEDNYQEDEMYEDEDQEDDDDDVPLSVTRNKKRKRKKYGYYDEEFIDHEEEEEENEYGFLDEEEDEMGNLNGAEEEYVPKKKKKKKKKKSENTSQRRRDFDSRKPICEETRELYRNVICGQGQLEVTMRSARFEANRDCGVKVRRTAQFMALAGVKRDQVQRQVLCGVPLAWTPINDDDEKDELERERKGRPLRPMSRLEEGADAEFLQQYQDYCLALRAVFGLSQLEVGYQDLVFDRMEMGWYQKRGVKNKFSLMRKHLDRSTADLQKLMSEGEAGKLSKTRHKKPFAFTGEPSDTFQATIELTTEISRDEFDGIALIVARTVEQDQQGMSNSNQSPVEFEAICLDIAEGGDSRESQIRGAIRTIFDVWSLRRLDMNYIDKCYGIIRQYDDLAPTGDLIKSCRSLLSDADGSLRRLLSSDEIQCPKCSKMLPTAEIEDLLKYSVHQSAHGFAERFECACAEVDPHMTSEQRRAHAESVHLAHFNRCQLCEFFAEPKAMEKHFAREHKQTPCDDCSELETGSEGLRLHRIMFHPDKPVHSSSKFKKKDKSKPKAIKEEAGEEKKPKRSSDTCHVCGKEFYSRTNFQVHMRIHNTYTCDKCGISIQGYNIMRAHKRREHPDPSQAKGYPCEVCGKMMSSKRRQQEHYLRIHAPDHERPHLCPDCGRGFARKGELEAHRNVVHLKSRPYSCRFGCGEAFNHYATRGDHEKSKHGKRFPKSKEQDQFEKIFRPRQQT